RERPLQHLVWLGLDGREHAPVVPVPAGSYFRHALAPDGRRDLIMGSEASSFQSILALADLERGVVSRISQPEESGTFAAWSPDGHQIAYYDDAARTLIVRSLVDGSHRTWLAADRAYKRLDGWSNDGKALLFQRLDAATKWDLWMLPLEGDSTPRA